MKTKVLCSVALALGFGLMQSVQGQIISSGIGVNGGNAGGGYGGGQMPGMGMAAGNGYRRGGISHVTIQTPMMFRQQMARQFFASGGALRGPNTAAMGGYNGNQNGGYNR